LGGGVSVRWGFFVGGGGWWGGVFFPSIHENIYDCLKSIPPFFSRAIVIPLPVSIRPLLVGGGRRSFSSDRITSAFRRREWDVLRRSPVEWPGFF